MKRIIPDFKKSFVTSFMGFNKKIGTAEEIEKEYLDFLYKRERSLENRLIQLFDQVNIRGIVKTDPYSLPFHNEIVVKVNGSSDMSVAFDFTPVAKKILKEILNKEVDKVRFYILFNATDKGFMGFGQLEYRFRYIVPKTTSSTVKFSEDLGRKLFNVHTHAEITNLENPSQIVYRERDVINILKELGNPEPYWNKPVLSEETTKLGIDVFGDEKTFENWLYSKSMVMPKMPINYTNEEIITILNRIAYGVYS